MKSVSFALFYNGVKDKLTREQFQALEPDKEYFHFDGCWIGLGFSDDIECAWVSIAVGENPRFFWHVKRELKQRGVKQIGWSCREGSPAHKIALYYKAEIKDSGEVYENGQPCLECWANVNGGRNG